MLKRSIRIQNALATVFIITFGCALLNAHHRMGADTATNDLEELQGDINENRVINIRKQEVLSNPVGSHGNDAIVHHGINITMETDYPGVRQHANRTHPKFVLLLSYMRSGSSFVGDIFHHTPEVFYIYEPLDPLYVAMYGTADGWAIPADIYFHPNSTQRDVPEDEIKAVSWALETIFTCNIASWPGAMLRHTFWQAWVYKMKDIGPFKKCVNKHNITGRTAGNKQCSKHIGAVCGGRFNADKKQLGLCRSILWNDGEWRSSEQEIGSKLDLFALEENPVNPHGVFRRLFKTSREKLIEGFAEYFRCHDKLSAPLRKCAESSFDSVCRERSLRVVKTVRASSLSAADLLDPYSGYDFRLIHLFRDPRGYARSKNKSIWAQGLFEKNNATTQAIAYCKRVLRNEIDAATVSTTHNAQNRKLTMIYDDVVVNPQGNLKRIFDFLREPSIPQETLNWVKNNTENIVKNKEKTSSRTLALKWMETFLFKEVKDINAGCQKLFNYIEYNWIL